MSLSGFWEISALLADERESVLIFLMDSLGVFAFLCIRWD